VRSGPAIATLLVGPSERTANDRCGKEPERLSRELVEQIDGNNAKRGVNCSGCRMDSHGCQRSNLDQQRPAGSICATLRCLANFGEWAGLALGLGLAGLFWRGSGGQLRLETAARRWTDTASWTAQAPERFAAGRWLVP